MVQVEFLKFQNQRNKRGVNPNANLPCKKKYKLVLKLSGVQANYFKCFSEYKFEIVTMDARKFGYDITVRPCEKYK